MVIAGVLLVGEIGMTVVKGVQHLRIERQKQKKAESIRESKKEVADQAEARQKIALWVVQHFEGPEPIKKIEIGKIKKHGLLESSSASVDVRINGDYVISSILLSDGKPEDTFIEPMDDIYKYSNKTNNTILDGVEVIYWGNNE
ncbi:hypothetical protein FC32_GL001068 [Ligilactobacillus apodemi DSM 16634 = JCM 16172]|uniref:Uncharacterized protein n=2 Tax=Ligilactobacillus TaxID=2767887 RepID=A0A0R1TSG5_9LACO|nr:hypothetical protein FC32_GL001068 [Ligilactobacillus apodemi DSM 16634 = JCM 16172]